MLGARSERAALRVESRLTLAIEPDRPTTAVGPFLHRTFVDRRARHRL